MKRIISTLLILTLCFSLASCGKTEENTSSSVSTASKSQFLDLSESKYIEYYKDSGFDKSLYLECIIDLKGTEVRYTGAKSENKYYVKYVTDSSTHEYIFDGTTAYLINAQDLTAKEVKGIPSKYFGVVRAFSTDQLDRLCKTGFENIDGVEYIYETFATDNGDVTYYLNGDGAPVMMYNKQTNGVEETQIKISISKVNAQPAPELFVLGEELQVQSAS